MSRITLNEKLKKRADYKDVVKRISIAPKPIQYIIDTFNCAIPTANRLLQDLNIKISGNDELVAKQFVERLEGRFNNKYEAFNNSISKIRLELEEFSLETLRLIFKSLVGKEPNTKFKYVLLYGIAYFLQNRYYYKIHLNDIPEYVKLRGEQKIEDCLK